MKLERDKVRVFHVIMTIDVHMVAQNEQELIKQVIQSGATMIHELEDKTDSEEGSKFLDKIFSNTDFEEMNQQLDLAEKSEV